MPKTKEEKIKKYEKKLKTLKELPIKKSNDVNEKWHCPRRKCRGRIEWNDHFKSHFCNYCRISIYIPKNDIKERGDKE